MSEVAFIATLVGSVAVVAVVLIVEERREARRRREVAVDEWDWRTRRTSQGRRLKPPRKDESHVD